MTGCGSWPAALAIACAGLALSAAPLLAQRPGDAPSLEAATRDLRFRRVGPATMGGRVSDLAVDEADPSRFYVATATGGLWKTTNAGTTWQVLFDDQPDAVSLGAVALAAADPDQVWVGTGEPNNRQSSSWGNGVYRSVDGGESWTHAGLEDSRHIARIVIHPEDPRVVFVAALGSLWGSGGARGVYRTRDGGASWQRVLFVDDDTGATDLVMHPSDPNVLYAATYQRRRAGWGFNGGGPGSGIYRSTDGGSSWERLTGGMPPGDLGRIGLAVHRGDPDILYATIEHRDLGGVYRSDDAGTSWRRVSDTNPRPMYFSKIRVDPDDPTRVYLLAQALLVSDDGGATFRASWAAHPDHHALWIDPTDPDHLIDGNDGGIAISRDRGRTWRAVDNMDLAQLYHVGFDMERPYGLYAGLQDNMAWVGPNAVRSRLGIGNGDWRMVGEYDGFVTLPDIVDAGTIYTEAPGGRIFRVDRVTNERKLIQPRPAGGEPALRWNWDTPLILSPRDGSLLAGAHRVYRSADRGHSWEAISPDLTTGVDRDTLTLMGVPGGEIRLSRNDGVSDYPTITALAESPIQPGLLYAGTDDGRVQRSTDDGQSWQDVTRSFGGVPAGARVAGIAASRFDPAVAYTVFDGHQADDYVPYVYATADGGRSWSSIVAGIPAGHVVRAIAEDTRNPNLLFLGTELGLFFSLDRGRNWAPLRANLPTVPVYEIKIHPRENDLILATHGRGIWILDDITPLQELATARRAGTHLFTMRPATQRPAAEDRHFWGDQRFWGENPPRGAIVRYYVGRPARDVRIEIRDFGGRLVRSFGPEEGLPAHRGIHRVVWDLRRPPHPVPLIRVTPISTLFAGNGTDGPFVAPGDYSVSLIVDGRPAGATTVAVLPDPRSPIPTSRLDETRLARETLYDLHGTILDAEATLDALQEVLRPFGDALDPAPADAELRANLEATTRTLDRAAQELGAAGDGRRGRESIAARVGALQVQLLRASDPPTEWEARAIRDARADLLGVIRSINRVIVDELPALARDFGREVPSIGRLREPPEPDG